jgi:hypothetical protein
MDAWDVLGWFAWWLVIVSGGIAGIWLVAYVAAHAWRTAWGT